MAEKQLTYGQRPYRKRPTWPGFLIAAVLVSIWVLMGSDLEEPPFWLGAFVVGFQSIMVWAGLYAFSLRKNGSWLKNLACLGGLFCIGLLALWIRQGG